MRQNEIMTATLTNKLGVIESLERSISQAGVDDTNLEGGKINYCDDFDDDQRDAIIIIYLWSTTNYDNLDLLIISQKNKKITKQCYL